MEKLSQSIVGFICRNMQVDDEMAEVYKYRIEIFISSLINLLLIFVSSLLVGDLLAGGVFITLFILLRSYTGGYHAETYLRCSTAFIITFLAVFWTARIINNLNWSAAICAVVLVLAYIPIWMFAPVKNRHKYLSKEKIHYSRIISTGIYFVSAVVAIFLCLNKIWYGYLLVITDVAIALLILIEIFMQKKGYHPSGD